MKRKSYFGGLSLKTKPHKKYKSTSTWIYSLYRMNKEKINEKLKNVKDEDKMRAFKHILLEYADKKISEAARKNMTDSKLNKLLNKIEDPEKKLQGFLWSDKWSEYKDRAQENLIRTLQEHKALKELKEITGTPKNKKIDQDEIKWNREDKVYEYRGYTIDLSNSPKGIKFTKITTK